MADKMFGCVLWEKLTPEMFFPPQTLLISWLAMIGYHSLCCIPEVSCNGCHLDRLCRFM